MLKKNKKFTLLLSGLSGVLLTSSIAGVALTSCTTTSTSSSDVQYSYVIDWNNKDLVERLIIDDSGLVYSDNAKTTIIAISPKVKLTTVKIPSRVKSIMGYSKVMYQNNSNQTIVDQIPSGGSESDYTKVYQSYGAFQDMTSLETVVLESGSQLKSIGGLAFSGCTTLKTISGLSSSLDYIGTSAFNNCINLTSIDTTNVVKVNDNAFLNCNKLSSLNLSSVVYIGNSAFQDCSSLSSVDFSKNTALTSIGYAAFMGAMSSGSTTVKIDLSNVTLLKTIPNSAFQNCTNLGSVVLSSSNNLVAIGANAFSGATSLTQVGSATNTFTAPSSLGNYTVDSTTSYVTSGIGAYAFSGTQIATIDLSASTSATTPFTNATFKNMTALANVSFGSSSKITTLPYSLFEGDSALTSLTLPSSITTINDGTNNSDTTETNVDNKSPFYNSGLQSIDMSAITSYALSGTTSWNSVDIQNTTMLPKALFQGLTRLTSVVLKTGTVVIGEDAFNGASALTTVKENVTSTIAGETSTTTGLIISSTLGMINTNAFKGTAIPTVAFANTTEDANNSLWFVGQGAFQDTTVLTTVDLSKADTTTSHTINSSAYTTPTSGSGTDSNGVGLYSISTDSFNGATALTTINLPTSISTIYSNAFVNNTALSSVNFSELTSLSNILSNNFTGASALSSIDLSNAADNLYTNSLSSSTTNVIFTGLPDSAIVKLPAIATSLNSSSFLTGDNTTASPSARPAIEYPSGLNITTTTNTVSSKTYTVIGSTGVSVDSANTMLQYISGEFDLSSATNGDTIEQYYPKTFFGNTKLKKLTLSAKNLYTAAASGSNPTQQDTLFIHNAGNNTINDSQYVYDKLPFGGNAALTDLVFSNFDLNSSPEWPTVNSNKDQSNSLYRTTSTTWAQVSTIINKFASNDTVTPTDWAAGSDNNAPDTTSKINADSVATGTPDTTSSGKYTVSFTNSQDSTTSTTYSSSADVSNTIASGTNVTKTFIHNGVNWTLTIASGGAITLIGTGINVYKVTKPSGPTDSSPNNRQICFNVTNGKASQITVTLNIYTPSSN